jgi:hypothetical protein
LELGKRQERREEEDGEEERAAGEVWKVRVR